MIRCTHNQNHGSIHSLPLSGFKRAMNFDVTNQPLCDLKKLTFVKRLVRRNFIIHMTFLIFSAFLRVASSVPSKNSFPRDQEDPQDSRFKSPASAPQVNVFIYDDPVFHNADLLRCYRKTAGMFPWLDERFDVAENLGEIWLHRALLEHPWRVLDPDDADLFFVPLYPFLSYRLLVQLNHNCNILPHWRRMDSALMFLYLKSPYFNRYGGADHVFVCTWWQCHAPFSPFHRMMLRRTILGVYEPVDYWLEWGCLGRTVTVPYAAHSSITSSAVFGGVMNESNRNVPFFFAGTARDRPERENLEVSRRVKCV